MTEFLAKSPRDAMDFGFAILDFGFGMPPRFRAVPRSGDRSADRSASRGSFRKVARHSVAGSKSRHGVAGYFILQHQTNPKSLIQNPQALSFPEFWKIFQFACCYPTTGRVPCPNEGWGGARRTPRRVFWPIDLCSGLFLAETCRMHGKFNT